MNIHIMQSDALTACADLAHRSYLAEQNTNNILPDIPTDCFEQLLQELLVHGNAFVAEDRGEICGYLGFYPPFDGAFGDCRGVFSPIHANAFFGKDPAYTCSVLLTYAMEHFYAQGITSIAVSHYAHDDAILRTLALNGFGFRCSDMMCKTAPAKPTCDGYTFRTMQPKDILHVLRLYNALEAHMAASPVFMPKSAWSEERLLPITGSILVACKEDIPIAAMLMEHGGETFVDEQPHVLHVSSTFCHPDHRGTGAMAALVDYATDHAHRAGYTHLGVDCETLNPPAFRFWQKHFAPFTYSAVRRLDERLMHR